MIQVHVCGRQRRRDYNKTSTFFSKKKSPAKKRHNFVKMQYRVIKLDLHILFVTPHNIF
jgi:hypothetical protein